MIERYDDAAARHLADAGLLLEDRRLDNADQLFGFAAECALKSTLVNPPTHTKAGELPKAYRTHVDELWDRITLGAVPRQYAALQALLKMLNPFHDWSVDQRYYPSGHASAEAVERHRLAARRVLGAVGIVGVRAGTQP